MKILTGLKVTCLCGERPTDITIRSIEERYWSYWMKSYYKEMVDLYYGVYYAF